MKNDMAESDDIVITDTLGVIRTDAKEKYLVHLLCLNGMCKFRFNGKEYELRTGDLSIIRRRELIENIQPSADFRAKIVYAKPLFIETCVPHNNYAIKGSMSLFLNPIIHLTPEQQTLCLRGMEILESRLKSVEHCFYRETLMNAMQTLILDFFDFHAQNNVGNEVSAQSASLMTRFLKMLEEGTYRKHREVAYYADVLCVTPKYLSEVSKNVSGFAANYWINRHTILDIQQLLRDKSLPLTEIADLFDFSSTAYFSRYVQQHLGVKPTAYR